MLTWNRFKYFFTRELFGCYIGRHAWSLKGELWLPAGHKQASLYTGRFVDGIHCRLCGKVVLEKGVEK